jgi:type I pantothenate kinase
VIVEGINILQVGAPSVGPTTDAREFVSDYFDFSIFIDADEAHIQQWYVERFMTLRQTVFQDPNSFFRHYADLTDEEAVATAQFIWREINGRNLRENIDPTKARARLLLRKGVDHRVTAVSLRRL